MTLLLLALACTTADDTRNGPRSGPTGDDGGDSATPDDSADPSACDGLPDGEYCDEDDLIACRDGEIAGRTTCDEGCQETSTGASCLGECPDEPAYYSDTAPTSSCSNMDWGMEPDAHYLISQFGTSWDSTTWGGTTSCGWLQQTYDYYECRWDGDAETCLDDDYDIPWIQEHVDHDYDDVVSVATANAGSDSPHPEYYYVADSQRFGCGATLRVTSIDNGRCVVVYTEDGGPNALYEGPDYGGRRVLDSSPAVIEYLDITQHGWGNSQLVYVEWGEDGDVPGHACDECLGTPAAAGTEAFKTQWDLNHFSTVDCE